MLSSLKVIRVTALDADEGSNGAVTYNIVDGADSKFIIEGQIQKNISNEIWRVMELDWFDERTP